MITDNVTELGLLEALDGGLEFSFLVTHELKLITGLMDVVIKICDLVVAKCPQSRGRSSL
jgi:hypothetical protein